MGVDSRSSDRYPTECVFQKFRELKLPNKLGLSSVERAVVGLLTNMWYSRSKPKETPSAISCSVQTKNGRQGKRPKQEIYSAIMRSRLNISISKSQSDFQSLCDLVSRSWRCSRDNGVQYISWMKGKKLRVLPTLHFRIVQFTKIISKRYQWHECG